MVKKMFVSARSHWSFSIYRWVNLQVALTYFKVYRLVAHFEPCGCTIWVIVCLLTWQILSTRRNRGVTILRWAIASLFLSSSYAQEKSWQLKRWLWFSMGGLMISIATHAINFEKSAINHVWKTCFNFCSVIGGHVTPVYFFSLALWVWWLQTPITLQKLEDLTTSHHPK